MKKLTGFITTVLFAAAVTSSCADVAKHQMNNIHNQVAEDAVKQYEIAKREGDKVQTYVQASMVAAAYLQAKDEANYRKWKAIEKEAAREAGMPTE